MGVCVCGGGGMPTWGLKVEVEATSGCRPGQAEYDWYPLGLHKKDISPRHISATLRSLALAFQLVRYSIAMVTTVAKS